MLAFALAFITITVNPPLQLWSRDAMVIVTIRVEKDDANRKLTVVVDGPSSRVEWDEQLDGSSAPRMRQRRVGRLSPGSYTVTATVYRNDNTSTTSKTTFEMKGGLEE